MASAEGSITPQAQVIGQAMQSSLVQVSPRQKSNPVLSLLAHVKWEFCENLSAADYVCGSALVVFVSLKFHLLKSTYVERRLKEMGSMGRLRVLLVYCDDDDQRGVAASMLEINKLCFEHNFTCLLAWSDQECARYIETLKLYEKRGAAAITERSETDFIPRITKVLGNVRSINRTDASTLLETFGSFQGICVAEAHQLALIPGFGEKKVKRLYAALNAPLRRGGVGAARAGAGPDEASQAALLVPPQPQPQHQHQQHQAQAQAQAKQQQQPRPPSSAALVYGGALGPVPAGAAAGAAAAGTGAAEAGSLRDGTIAPSSLLAFQQLAQGKDDSVAKPKPFTFAPVSRP